MEPTWKQKLLFVSLFFFSKGPGDADRDVSLDCELSSPAGTEPFTPAQLYRSIVVQGPAFIINIFIPGDKLPNKHYWVFLGECWKMVWLIVLPQATFKITYSYPLTTVARRLPSCARDPQQKQSNISCWLQGSFLPASRKPGRHLFNFWHNAYSKLSSWCALQQAILIIFSKGKIKTVF